MKKTLLLIVALLILLASCSADWGKNIYYGGVAGTVKDSDTDSAVSGVNVYVYTSEKEMNAAYDAYISKGGRFSDDNCLYKATTGNDGKWYVNKIVWMKSDGAWGSDYDHTPVWIIYFSEAYGCWKGEEKIELLSGSSNTNAVETRRQKVIQSSTLTLNFREGNKAISDEITFTYSYSDGYRTREYNVVTNGGRYTINLSFVKSALGADVRIYDIKAPNGCWNTSSISSDSTVTVSSGEAVINVKEASVTKDIKIERSSYDLGESGISGTITAPRSVVLDATGTSVEHSLDSLVVVATIGGKTFTALTDNCDYNSDNARSFSVRFSALGVNSLVDKGTPEIEIKVFKQGTKDFLLAPLATYALDLESNYSGKNSLSINIPSWT